MTSCYVIIIIPLAELCKCITENESENENVGKKRGIDRGILGTFRGE